MKRFIVFLISILTISSSAQKNFKVYYEEGEKGYTVFADNGEYSPVSVEINFKIDNLTSSIGTSKIIVVPAQTTKYYIADLTVIEIRKAIKLGFGVRYNHGNHLQKIYDADYEYQLPFQKGTSHVVTQGYNGAISHKDEYALDFRMPIGTKIYAAREGVVVLVEQGFNKTCTDANCAKFNNYILVYHSDGTFAEYTHIKKNGAVVKAGDAIKTGQFIGYSGNIGWSTGPHLHFIVFLQRFTKRETLPTKFLIDAGKQALLLEERKEYSRKY
ncbi:M23 family metallopeptidase [Aquimarina sp. RZ0]|uniref:M23 family metallopeptidase n=1 Tax=Aquimarina sp. RZ0 TaxID=2607730 RepID=UPI0011F1CF99|nr:M23 family metallopeptidase [Aquimarina sp. RZ0]KAA1247215.1 M23 family metallopeptidase [Aquimarina sp. RZ0]KAA1247222.1 M23 family metallopeptidase [Aquimarina sp. RZ0]